MSVVLIPQFGAGDKQAFIHDDGIKVLNFCLKSPTRAWVSTNAGQFGIASPWHAYLALHFTDPELQFSVVCAPTVEEAEFIARANVKRMREDFREIEKALLSWVIRLHLAMRFKSMLPELISCRGAEVYYLSDSKRFGCVADANTHTYIGRNYYGKQVRKLIEAFGADPTKFLVVEPPAIEGITFLGSPIRTYRRSPFHDDKTLSPKASELYGHSITKSKSKTEQYLEG